MGPYNYAKYVFIQRLAQDKYLGALIDDIKCFCSFNPKTIFV